MSASLIKFVEKLLSSAKNPYGHFDGPDVTFAPESTFKCTPPSLLAAMRFLSAKYELLRKISFSKDSKSKAITSFKLQEQFNTIAGVKGSVIKSFAVKLFKAILSSSTKLSNRGFPGGYIHSMRARNGVKTDSAVLTLLGWTPKIPSQARLLEVIFNPVDDSFGVVDGRQKVISRSMANLTKAGRNTSYQEFRTAVAFSVPKLSVSSSEPLDDQLKREPLAVWDKKVISNFVEPKRLVSTNLLQQSYALKVSVTNPKSKTGLVHYEIARNRFLHSTSDLNLVDADGNVYKTFSELPKVFQEYLRKKYRYPTKSGSERRPDDVQESQMAVDSQGDSSAQPPPVKKKRLSRADATRLRKEEGELRRSTRQKKK
jgi:hypothetical protein